MLTADSATRNALSQTARARVVANFSIAHAAEQYQHTYQSLIES
jgi:glycosyltransferase involved in cell wall biosynthesis